MAAIAEIGVSGLIEPEAWVVQTLLSALGRNSLRDLLLVEGNADLIGSRDTLQLAFRMGLIRDGESCLLMVQDRNLTSHTSNPITAAQSSSRSGSATSPVSGSCATLCNGASSA